MSEADLSLEDFLSLQVSTACADIDDLREAYSEWLVNTSDQLVADGLTFMAEQISQGDAPSLAAAHQTKVALLHATEGSPWVRTVGSLMLLVSSQAPATICRVAANQELAARLSYQGEEWRPDQVAFEIVAADLEEAIKDAVDREMDSRRKKAEAQAQKMIENVKLGLEKLSTEAAVEIAAMNARPLAPGEKPN